jgi:hypothetical protein
VKSEKVKKKNLQQKFNKCTRGDNWRSGKAEKVGKNI